MRLCSSLNHATAVTLGDNINSAVDQLCVY